MFTAIDPIDTAQDIARALAGNVHARAWIAQDAARLGGSAEAQAAADALTAYAAGAVDTDAVAAAWGALNEAHARLRNDPHNPAEPTRADKAVWYAAYQGQGRALNEIIWEWLEAAADAGDGPDAYANYGSPTWQDSQGASHLYAAGSRPASRAAALSEEQRDKIKVSALRRLAEAFSIAI